MKLKQRDATLNINNYKYSSYCTEYYNQQSVSSTRTSWRPPCSTTLALTFALLHTSLPLRKSSLCTVRLAWPSRKQCLHWFSSWPQPAGFSCASSDLQCDRGMAEQGVRVEYLYPPSTPPHWVELETGRETLITRQCYLFKATNL